MASSSRLLRALRSHLTSRAAETRYFSDLRPPASGLLCSTTKIGEAGLYAAPLAPLGETDRAAGLLQAASEDRCDMLAMVLRDPAHSHWLPAHRTGRRILRSVFGPASAGE